MKSAQRRDQERIRWHVATERSEIPNVW